MNLETIEQRRDALFALRQAMINNDELADNYDIIFVRIIKQLNSKAMAASLVSSLKEKKQ